MLVPADLTDRDTNYHHVITMVKERLFVLNGNYWRDYIYRKQQQEQEQQQVNSIENRLLRYLPAITTICVDVLRY